HNKEYIVENPGKPLIMTNFTLHENLEDGKPPSADKARPVCKRYAYLSEKLAKGNLDDKSIRGFHQNVDAQMSQAANATSPPERTFWHAFYYPEDRRVRLSYFLGEEPYPGQPRLVKQIRSEYLEFRLEPTGSAPTAAATPTPMQTPTPTGDVGAAIEAAGGAVEREGARIVSVNLQNAKGAEALVPRLAGLRDLRSLGLMGVPIGDDALAIMKTLPALRELNI